MRNVIFSMAVSLDGYIAGPGVLWERPDDSRGAGQREFAGIWQSLPKIVFSSTLDAVEGNARLATGDPAEELVQLEGDIAVGGALAP